MHALQKHTGRIVSMVTLGMSALAVAVPAAAQNRETNAFTWSGTVPQGRRIMVKNINGAIRVERGSGNRVEVTADKEWRRGDPEDVRIEQKRTSGDDILVCAMWHPESRCEEDGINTPRGSRNRNDRNDVSVRFVVRVPEGVRVDVTTVNGELEISGATSEVIAHTVNGSIRARTSGGPIRAKTVNGSIDVAMGSLNNVHDLEYETVNGSITVEVPSNFSAQLELSTVNGSVRTDFPITVSGTLSPRRLRGTIGSGAIRVSASTVNGGVTLRRGN